MKLRDHQQLSDSDLDSPSNRFRAYFLYKLLEENTYAWQGTEMLPGRYAQAARMLDCNTEEVRIGES